MDTRAGELIYKKNIPIGKEKHFSPVVRDVSVAEKAQRQINLYSPCGCGSGKNFKFCCHKLS